MELIACLTTGYICSSSVLPTYRELIGTVSMLSTGCGKPPRNNMTWRVVPNVQWWLRPHIGAEFMQLSAKTVPSSAHYYIYFAVLMKILYQNT